MPDIKFDIQGARKAGATDSDISLYFKQNYNIDFDIAGARKAGASDSDILGYINNTYSNNLKKKPNQSFRKSIVEV